MVKEMKVEIDVYDFQRMFERMDRDYYSREAYEILFNFYDELDIEPDVVGICGEWTEYTPEELKSDYKHIYSFDEYIEDNFENIDEAFEDGYTMEELEENHLEELVKQLEYNTTVYVLSNDNYLVMAY
jgi:hypothetical protein